VNVSFGGGEFLLEVDAVADGTGVKGIVLAGVHRWAESGLEKVLPRPMLPILCRPLISYPLRWLKAGGVVEATVCANSESGLVRQYIGAGGRFGVDVDYYEDLTPRGPAGCARDAASTSNAERFVVVDGTIIPQADLAGLLKFHLAARSSVTVVVTSLIGRGVQQNGHLVPAGIYIFEREAFEHVQRTSYQDIKEVLIPALDRAGRRVLSYIADRPSPRVHNMRTYLAANAWLLERLSVFPVSLPGYRRMGDGFVHESSVAESVRFVGPVFVGPGTRLGSRVTLVGPSVVGPSCEVGCDAVISRSVLWKGCHVGEGAMIDSCVLTSGASAARGARFYESVLIM